MKAFSHIGRKKTIAVLFAALLVFIHTEKMMHHHDRKLSQSQENGYSIDSNTFSCSICDYVFAKDAGLPEQSVLTLTFKVLTDWTNQDLPFYFNPSLLNIADRGPPAC